MTSEKNTDWAATRAALSILPQEQHADYLAMLNDTKTRAKGITAKAVAIEVKPEEATGSKVQEKAKKAKSSTKAKSSRKRAAVAQKKAKVNGAFITFHQYSMLQTVRELVANGVNGAEGLSSTEIAEYRVCGETGGEVSSVLDRLKACDIIDWRLVEVNKKPDETRSWPSRNFPSSSKRREFTLLA